jgi:hypothetical protein
VTIASSSSGLRPSQLQGMTIDNPDRILIGHPFNPVYLIPLVEVVPGRLTDPVHVDAAMSFYLSVGKRPILVRREVPGHVTNRLQAALWREAYSLVERGVANVSDIDAAIANGPGLRWALHGPLVNQTHLGRFGWRSDESCRCSVPISSSAVGETDASAPASRPTGAELDGRSRHASASPRRRQGRPHRRVDRPRRHGHAGHRRGRRPRRPLPRDCRRHRAARRSAGRQGGRRHHQPVGLPDLDSLVVPADGSAAAEITAALPQSHVLKAFNTTFAATLAIGTVGDQATTVLIAGDDAEAKALLTDIITGGAGTFAGR